MKITIFGGIDEIGGNKILVTSEENRSTLLDFGLSYSIQKTFFDEFMKIRRFSPIQDQVILGMLPAPTGAIAKLYRPDLPQIQINSKKIEFDASKNTNNPLPSTRTVYSVFLSHAHLDHIHDVKYLNPSIQVAASKITLEIMEYIQATSTSGKELLSYIPKRVQDGQLSIMKKRDVLNSPSDEYFSLGGGDFRAIYSYVDHSIPGAAALVLTEESSGKTLVYTGDIRFHGRLANSSWDFVKYTQKIQPDVLISEGTRINGDNDKELADETAVENEIKGLAKSSEGKLLLFGCSARDISRFVSFYNAAHSVGRTLVVDAKVYSLWKLLKDVHSYHVNLLDVKVFYPRKKSGNYAPTDYNESDPIKQLIKNPRADQILVKANQIHNEQGKYLVYLPRWQINELLDLHPDPGFIYIWSQSEPFDLEGEINEQKFNAWMEFFQGEVAKAHCSGHARPEDLAQMVNMIHPRILIPVHTENPAIWEQIGLEEDIEIRFPRKGECIEV